MYPVALLSRLHEEIIKGLAQINTPGRTDVILSPLMLKGGTCNKIMLKQCDIYCYPIFRLWPKRIFLLYIVLNCLT